MFSFKVVQLNTECSKILQIQNGHLKPILKNKRDRDITWKCKSALDINSEIESVKFVFCQMHFCAEDR
jgi:hypothetical protein